MHSDSDDIPQPKIEAPWSADQVNRLNLWQVSGAVQPFTCDQGDHGELVATANGWLCPGCDYTQTWANLRWVINPPPSGPTFHRLPEGAEYPKGGGFA